MFDDVTKPLVLECLANAGWVITQDPKHIYHAGYNFFIDLEIEKDGVKRLIEIKSFKRDFLDNFYSSIGKLVTYQEALDCKGDTTPLFLAVPYTAYKEHFQKPFISAILAKMNIKLVVYNSTSKKITTWTK